MTIIYHNPRCSKSRNALALLKEKNEEIEIIEYLKTSPTTEELTKVIELLGISPLELIRTNEKTFKENYQNTNLSDEEWIEVMVKNPILIERPVVIKGDQAAIGRPIENILTIL